jgi:hypothetical protein
MQPVTSRRAVPLVPHQGYDCLTWHIPGSVALWFRGDAAGFGISDNQSNLTYNLIGGLE